MSLFWQNVFFPYLNPTSYLNGKLHFCEWIWKHHTTMSPKKHDSSRVEGLSSLPEREWAVAESQRGMMQRMRRMTTKLTKEIEKYKHLVWCNLISKEAFYSQVKTYKGSYKLLIMSPVSCRDELLSNYWYQNKKKDKERNVLFPLLGKFTL